MGVPVLFLVLFLISCQSQTPPFECSDSIGCVTVGLNDPIKIGVLQSLSGKVASLGQEQVRGLELALDERKWQILR